MIRKRIFDSSGEDGAIGEKCPGEQNCSDFKKALGKAAPREAKESEACTHCKLFPTKTREIEIEDAEIENLVDEIERLIWLDNCHQAIDFTKKDFIYYYLFEYWRKCEKEVENVREIRMSSFLKVWMTMK